MPPQRQKHISQKVGMVFTSPPPLAALDSGATCVATAPAPKLAAEILRNLLRESCSIVVPVGCRMARRNNHAHSTPHTPHGI
jgi:hypothetical protein